MKKAIVNGIFFNDGKVEKNKVILVDKGTILSIRSTVPGGYEKIDLHGKNLAPGLIDLQMNGGERLYFSQYPDENTLLDMAQSCDKYGTSYFLPTLISSSLEKILEAIESVRRFRAAHPDGGVLGMHLEGPFINPAKRGTHNPYRVRKATDKEIERIATHGKGIIKLMTIAPEVLTGNQIKVLQNSGITLSVGHSDLSYEEAQKYFSKDHIRLVTHLYNAMSDFAHRAPGIVGAALDNEKVYTPFIADGHHSHFAAGRIAYKIKKDKFLLTTDCAFLGRKMKAFHWEDFDIVLEHDSYINKEGHLAGSAIAMPEAVSNAVTHLKVSTQEAIAMATSHVARALGLDKQIGFIKEGFPREVFCV